MLKWAVKQPRPSYLNDGMAMATATTSATRPTLTPAPAPAAQTTLIATSSYSEFHAAMPEQRCSLPRKSSQLLLRGSSAENQLTSTPLPLPLPLPQPQSRSSDFSQMLKATPSPRAVGVPSRSAYASTLPTFEAEYSPSGPTTTEAMGATAAIIAGPLLALRGLGIPDSYFEKPRYLEQKALPPATQQHSHQLGQAAEPTLSSTQMGDVTLERMIDAILASAPRSPHQRRRQRRQHQHQHQRNRQCQRQRQRLSTPLASRSGSHSNSNSHSNSHSPTYRPAYDPASDLSEYWQPSGELEDAAQLAEKTSHRASCCRSPRHLHLRRQRVVRRKRKLTLRISSSVRQSAQKLLAAAARSAQKLPRSSQHPAHRQQERQRQISPDSGHNSTSELDEQDVEELLLDGEELEASCNLGDIWQLPSSQALDATKRRLSFSLSHIAEGS